MNYIYIWFTWFASNFDGSEFRARILKQARFSVASIFYILPSSSRQHILEKLISLCTIFAQCATFLQLKIRQNPLLHGCTTGGCSAKISRGNKDGKLNLRSIGHIVWSSASPSDHNNQNQTKITQWEGFCLFFNWLTTLHLMKGQVDLKILNRILKLFCLTAKCPNVTRGVPTFWISFMSVERYLSNMEEPVLLSKRSFALFAHLFFWSGWWWAADDAPIKLKGRWSFSDDKVFKFYSYIGEPNYKFLLWGGASQANVFFWDLSMTMKVEQMLGNIQSAAASDKCKHQNSSPTDCQDDDRDDDDIGKWWKIRITPGLREGSIICF